uniref:RING-type domain-containing protein n=1 Tax=Dicentrarchus labrax TaxID=13489 RepID=A0A8P4KH31_DICLA
MELARSHVSVEEQLSCCVLCQDVLKDPVSTSCGHWFCRQCITSYWDQSASSGDSSCPQCGKRSRTRAGPQTASQTIYLETYNTFIQPRGYNKKLHESCHWQHTYCANLHVAQRFCDMSENLVPGATVSKTHTVREILFLMFPQNWPL